MNQKLKIRLKKYNKIKEKELTPEKNINSLIYKINHSLDYTEDLHNALFHPELPNNLDNIED